MFGIWRTSKTKVIKHWYVLLPNFAASTEEFYRSIEQELETQQISGLVFTREEFAEGGMLSAKRVYLRMRWERLVFDVCSAPFGTAWFFSCRFAIIPFVLRVWELTVFLLALGIAFAFYGMLFGLILGAVLFAASFIGTALLFRNLVFLGLQDLDLALLRAPIFGSIYEVFFRKDSYYRQDTRVLYVDVVHRLVGDKVQEVASLHGFGEVQFEDVKPFEQEQTLLGMIWSAFTSLFRPRAA